MYKEVRCIVKTLLKNFNNFVPRLKNINLNNLGLIVFSESLTAVVYDVCINITANVMNQRFN